MLRSYQQSAHVEKSDTLLLAKYINNKKDQKNKYNKQLRAWMHTLYKYVL